MSREPDRSAGDADAATDSIGAALFTAFDDLLGSAVVRRPNVSGSSANASAIDVASPSLRFGATAALPEPGRPLYRFTRGTCLAFADVGVLLVARPDFMPDSPLVGIDMQRVEPTRFRARFIDYDGGDAEHVLLPLQAFAEGDKRLEAFDDVFAMAVRFVALHEQAHYYNGHLHAVRTADAVELPEIGRAVERGMPSGFRRRVEQCLGMDWPRASRALELQADAWAVRHLLGFGRRSDARHAPRGRSSVAEIRSVADWLRHAMLGVACACTIFEVNDRHVTTRALRRCHPPAVHRTLTALEELGHQLPELVPGVTAMAEFMGILVHDLDILFDVVGVRPITADDFNAAFAEATPEPEAVTSWRACRQDVVDLMPHLDPFGAQAKAELGAGPT